MKHIYFVRHGETEANVARVYSPEDTELTERGRDQAAAIEMEAHRRPIDVIIASPLKRTMDTAAIINRVAKTEIILEPLLVEVKRPDEVEGMPYHDERTKQYIPECKDDCSWDYPSVENFCEFRDRVQEALDKIIERPEEHILVVTHSHTMKMIMSLVLFDRELSNHKYVHLGRTFTTQNTGITYTRYYKDTTHWELVTWNSYAHLDHVRHEDM